jgi:uncharacterized cupin superfamily protein
VSDFGDNVWEELEDMGDGISGKRLRRSEGSRLVAAVWELAPGSSGVVYHFHHGIEELLVVLRGRPTLHAKDGQRQLAEGEVVHFPPGPDGAHKLSNPTDAPARYLMAAATANANLDIIEYPEDGTFAAYAKTKSQRGEPFFVRRTIDDPDA